MKRTYLTTVAIILATTTANAATVNCSFITETTISTDGQWLRSEMDFMKLYNIFGDGLTLPLENSLLGNLDTSEPFLAGEVERGKVYLKGTDMGVEGKLINVDRDQLTIYDGYCTVGFG